MISLLKQLSSKLRADQRGVAAVEFALLSLLFLSVLVVALDFGLYFQHRRNLNGAVEQGAVYAFNTRSSNIPVANIQNYVIASARLRTPPTVTIACNGNSAAGACDIPSGGRTCACISGGTGSTPITYTPATCGTGTCPSGALPGHYMTITATAPYSSLVIPNRYLNGTNMTAKATVRLR